MENKLNSSAHYSTERQAAFSSLAVQTVDDTGKLVCNGLTIPHKNINFSEIPSNTHGDSIDSFDTGFGDYLTDDQLNDDAARFVGAIRKIKQRNPDYDICYKKMMGYVEKQGVNKPTGSKKKKIDSMMKASWWKSAIKKQDRLMHEHERRCAGLVSRNKSSYASKHARSMQLAYEVSLEKYLKEKYLINESTGEIVSLWDLVQHTNFNSVVKLAEVTKRLDGMQDQAAVEGMVARFITITCPSKYHRFVADKKDKSKDRFNKKFDKTLTSRDAKNHLSKVVRLAHKTLSNKGIPVIGCRILESHHDGCPHLHAVVYAKPDQIDAVVTAYKSEALRVDGGERGAENHRFDCKDMYEGGAVGYLMKYLTKNLNQESDLVDDQTGKSYSDSNCGIAAWVRLNSIVQFAFWGDCGIGVFRILYKLDKNQTNTTILSMMQAATDNDYGAYIALQGGLGTKFEDRAVKAHRTVTGRNADGEEIKKITHLDVSGELIEIGGDKWSESPLTVASETRSLEVMQRLPKTPSEPIESTVSASDLSHDVLDGFEDYVDDIERDDYQSWADYAGAGSNENIMIVGST